MNSLKVCLHHLDTRNVSALIACESFEALMRVISSAMVRASADLSSDVAIDRPTIELFLRNSLRFVVASSLHQKW
jgi:hypothetical protein